MFDLYIAKIHGLWFGQSLTAEQREQIMNLPHIREKIRFIENDIIEILGHPIFIGRHSSNHIFIDSLEVSQKHCQINKHMLGHWYIQDLQSSNGTWIERGTGIVREMTGEFKLEKGDVIHLSAPASPNRVSLRIIP